MAIDNVYFHLTIEVEGKEIRFKRIRPFSKVKKLNMDDIIGCNLTLKYTQHGFAKYTGLAFSYFTSDFKRHVIGGDNLEGDDWNRFIELVIANKVPVYDFAYEG